MSFTISTPLIWESIAVFFGITYVLLVARHNPLGWIADFICTGIYVVLFLRNDLPMQALLNAYYLIMAIYGWLAWQKQRQLNSIPLIVHMRKQEHIIFIISAGILSFLVGYLLTTLDWSQHPYLDSTTAIFAMFNTWLMIQNRLESWLYWIAIDALSIWLYITTEHTPTALLFIVYLILAYYGYWQWHRYLQAQNDHQK